jgi:cysteine synthase
MERLRQLARKDDTICYLGQYDNADVREPQQPISLLRTNLLQNWKSHERWTGPQILQQLPEVDVFSTTVGTGGTLHWAIIINNIDHGYVLT